MAPGLTFGSQSLQSPCAGVQPSMSMSAFMSVTLQWVGPPPLPPSPKVPTVASPGRLPLLLPPLLLLVVPLLLPLDEEPPSPTVKPLSPLPLEQAAPAATMVRNPGTKSVERKTHLHAARGIARRGEVVTTAGPRQ